MRLVLGTDLLLGPLTAEYLLVPLNEISVYKGVSNPLYLLQNLISSVLFSFARLPLFKINGNNLF